MTECALTAVWPSTLRLRGTTFLLPVIPRFVFVGPTV
jgi:hypothetical protein